MIQTEIHMARYCDSKPVQVSDKQMVTLDWLHHKVRNEFEHFKPKGYSVCEFSSIGASLTCIEISRQLLLESGNLLAFDFKLDELEKFLEQTEAGLRKQYSILESLNQTSVQQEQAEP